MSEIKKKVCLLQGNEACAEGAIAAGCNFFAGYPITPATEIAEALSKRLPQTKGMFLQMEDELACMGAVCGASLAGAKAMTATSGPGYTLLQENIGFAIINDIPCVIFDVQRGGPSTGLPTLPSQSDVMQARWGTHGDHSIIAVAPSSVSECYYLTVEAFNYAEKYRTPVMVLSDAVIGHMRERIDIPENGEGLKIVNRVQPPKGLKDYKPYDASHSKVWGVPEQANIGEGYRNYMSGCCHDETGSPKMGSPAVARQLVGRLCDKINRNRDDIVRFEYKYKPKAKVVVLAYGSVARPAEAAVKEAAASGMDVGFFRPITLWPSPDKELLSALENADKVIVAEMNYGQYAGEVERILGAAMKSVKVVKLDEIGSEMILPNTILDKIKEVY